MYQDSKRTCTAIVLLIKPYVWWRTRCRRRRGFVNSLLLKGRMLSHERQFFANFVVVRSSTNDVSSSLSFSFGLFRVGDSLSIV